MQLQQMLWLLLPQITAAFFTSSPSLTHSFLSRQQLRSRPPCLVSAQMNTPLAVPLNSTSLPPIPVTFSLSLVRDLVPWGGLALSLTVMAPFRGVMLGTFVVSFIVNSFTKSLMGLLERRGIKMDMEKQTLRRLLLTTAYVLTLFSVGVFCVLTLPRVVQESKLLIQVSESHDPYTLLARGITALLGDDLTGKLEAFLVGVSNIRGVEVLVQSDGRSRLVQLVEANLKDPVRNYIVNMVTMTRDLVAGSANALAQGVLSLLFSFIILWDLPLIKAGLQRLKTSRVSHAYKTLAPQLLMFGRIMGRSFEAQTAIAVGNTVLTTAGLVLLQIPGSGLLSVIVFFCSFVPLLGIFFSTVPMAIIALTEYGALKLLYVVLMIVVVHLLEAWVLNPQIYSNHLELHPLLVLTTLYVAEHLFGIPGMLLAVPVTVYMIENIMAKPNPVV